MPSNFIRRVLSLDLEEKILNIGALVAAIGVLFPWVSGEWLGGQTVSYSGMGFYTSVLGITVFLLNIFVLLVTLIPLTGGPALIRKKYKNLVRLCLTGTATILVIASLSVLTKVTFEFSRMEVRWGIYIALIGSLVATLYSFLRLQESRRAVVREIFHQPEQDTAEPAEQMEMLHQSQPTVPPPPAPEAEEHRLHV